MDQVFVERYSDFEDGSRAGAASDPADAADARTSPATGRRTARYGTVDDILAHHQTRACRKVGFVGNEATRTGANAVASGARECAMPLLAAMSDQRRFAVVILAAGQGTRMRSDTHKVLHPIASRPLLLHLLDRVDALGAEQAGRRRRQGPRPGRGGDRRPRCRRSRSRPSRRAPATPSSRRRARSTATTGRSSSSTATRRSSRPRRCAGCSIGSNGDGRARASSSSPPRPADPAQIRPDHPRPGRPHREDGRI